MRTNTHLYYESFSAFKAPAKPLLKQNPWKISFTFQFKQWKQIPQRNSEDTHDYSLSLSPSLSIMAMIKYRFFFFIEWSKPLLEYQARLLHASRERQTMCIIQQYIFMHPFGKGLNLGGLVMLCIIWEVKKQPNRRRK